MKTYWKVCREALFKLLPQSLCTPFAMFAGIRFSLLLDPRQGMGEWNGEWSDSSAQWTELL